MTADPYGRYMMISGHINSFQCLISMLQIGNPDFFHKAFDMIPASSPNVIIGGDFNCYLDPILDRLSTKPAPAIATVQTLNNLIRTRNMVDIRRLQHPTDRDFSFYSHVHKSYTRIDYFLISSELLPSITNSTYHSILISDHRPKIFCPNKSTADALTLYLLMITLTEHMTTRIDDFLTTNDNGEVCGRPLRL